MVDKYREWMLEKMVACEGNVQRFSEETSVSIPAIYIWLRNNEPLSLARKRGQYFKMKRELINHGCLEEDL
jgi:hypothetical protein